MPILGFVGVFILGTGAPPRNLKIFEQSKDKVRSSGSGKRKQEAWEYRAIQDWPRFQSLTGIQFRLSWRIPALNNKPLCARENALGFSSQETNCDSSRMECQDTASTDQPPV